MLRIQDVAQLAGLNQEEFEHVRNMDPNESHQIVLALALRLGNLTSEVKQNHRFATSELNKSEVLERQETFKEQIQRLEAELFRADERFTDMSIKLSATEKELSKSRESSMSRMEIIEDQKIEINGLQVAIDRLKNLHRGSEDDIPKMPDVTKKYRSDAVFRDHLASTGSGVQVDQYFKISVVNDVKGLGVQIHLPDHSTTLARVPLAWFKKHFWVVNS